MATVQYESKENAGRKFWTGRYGRYAIRIDANRPGVYRWLITLQGRSVRKGIGADRAEAATAVSRASAKSRDDRFTRLAGTGSAAPSRCGPASGRAAS